LNPDRFFEKDADDAERKDELPDKGESPARAGVTDIFGILPVAPATESTTVPEIPLATTPVPPIASQVHEPMVSRTPPPVVHEVVFNADPSPSTESSPLRQLLRSAPPASRPVEPTPPAPAIEAPTSSGGFTQLLRALNYDQIKPVEPAPVAASSVAPPLALTPAPPQIEIGSITQLLRTIDHPVMPIENTPSPSPAAPLTAVQAVPVVETAVQAALRTVKEGRPAATPPRVSAVTLPPSTQVTSFQQEAQPPVAFVSMDELRAAKSPATSETPAAVGSFTQMFNSLEATPPVADVQPVSPATAPGSFTQMFQALDTPVVESPRMEATVASESFTAVGGPLPPASPESFTQMFRSFDAEAAPSSATAENRVETAPSATASESFTQLFSRPASQPVADSQPHVAAQPAMPGSFTQMFHSLDAQAPPPSPADASRVEAASPATPGSFTQLFSTPVSQTVMESQPQEALQSSPGSFTQIFRSIDAQQAELHTPAPHSAAGSNTPGAFTQMFGMLSSPEKEPQRVEEQPARAEAGSFTQLFGTLSDTPPAAHPVPVPPSLAAPDAGAARTSDFGTGGASQVFSTQRSMPEPARGPAFFPSPISSPPSSAPTGGLTQLLRTLDRSPQPAAPYSSPAEPLRPASQPGTFTSAYGSLDGGSVYAPPTTPAPPMAPPLGAGPSEFTRILNASTLRESLLRAGEAPPAGVTPATAPQPPAMGLPPVAMPHPTLPAMPSAGGAPHLGMQPPAMPHLPAVLQIPQVKAPEFSKSVAPAVSKTQQMLPLLLILIIFLLIAVLIAVIILMKH
jgi:hypothetical protein